ncbi:response regulator [Patescibacteria group bacterium]|nr:response regulator [Patescibacteria group bacterium]
MSKNSKVLLVDDDANLLELYSTVFRKNNLNFVIAKNGNQALDKATSEKPNLILLDIMLPDVNGFDVLKQLRANPETKGITIWMLTVLAEQSNKTKAQELGADDYIVKSSYTPQQIVAKVKEFLAK